MFVFYFKHDHVTWLLSKTMTRHCFGHYFKNKQKSLTVYWVRWGKGQRETGGHWTMDEDKGNGDKERGGGGKG